MNKKLVFTIIIVGIIVLFGVWFSMDRAYKAKYVGSVDAVKIMRVDYQKKLDQSKTFYTYSKQDLSKLTSLSKDTLNGMINDNLIQNYASGNNITVSDTEVENRYQQVIAGFNSREKITETGDTKFLEKIKQMYGTDKNTYLAQVRMDLLKEKVQKAVGMPLVKWLEKEKQTAKIQENL